MAAVLALPSAPADGGVAGRAGREQRGGEEEAALVATRERRAQLELQAVWCRVPRGDEVSGLAKPIETQRKGRKREKIKKNT